MRSYISEATTERERTGAMAGVSSSQALGFILGPGVACRNHRVLYSKQTFEVTLLGLAKHSAIRKKYVHLNFEMRFCLHKQTSKIFSHFLQMIVGVLIM